jgi:hypothetical protein
MNGPTRGERAATTTRRFACVLALVLLFSTLGIGSMPDPGNGAQGFVLRDAARAAHADTSTGEMVDGNGYRENLLSTMTRHKTH